MEEAELGNGLKDGEFGIINISTTCDDPSDPDSNHDYGYRKGLDFDAAVKAYESGKKGKWDAWHGHTPGGVWTLELLLEEWDADKAATISEHNGAHSLLQVWGMTK